MQRGIFLGAILALTLGAPSAHAFEKGLPVCFFPGAGGGNHDSMERIPAVLKTRNIRFIPFELGKVGTVVDRARKLQGFFKPILEANPNFQCHVFAYSMGGPVSRYSYHHLSVTLDSGEVIPLKQVFASITTYSSPHRGTPLAEWLRRYSPKFSAGMDDLAEADMAKYNDPAYPATYSPEPTEIPNYSYVTFIKQREEGDDFLAKFGFDLITKMHSQRGIETKNDGIVPAASQHYGQVIAQVQVSHGFFSYDIGIRPWAPDFFETQYHFINGGKVSRAAQLRMRSLLQNPMIENAEALESAVLR